MKPLPLLPLALFTWAALSGCSTEVTETPDRLVVHWSSPIRALAWAAPVAAALLGLVLLRTVRFASTGFGCLFLSLVAIPFSGVVLADELVLTETEVYDRAGFPWNRYNRGFGLEGLQRVTLSTQRVRSRRSSYDETHWHLDYGSEERNASLSPGSLWDASQDIIMDHLEAAGIAIGPDLSQYAALGSAIDPQMQALFETPPIDAPQDQQRVKALLYSGAWEKLRRDGSSLNIKQSGADLEGTWETQIRHHGITHTLRLELRPDGTFEYAVEKKGTSQVCQGEWTLGASSWTMEMGGSTWELLF